MNVGVMVVLALVCSGCGDNCVDQAPAIANGVYGYVTYQTDVNPADHGPAPVPALELAVTDAAGAARGHVTTDATGYYEIVLAPGTYTIFQVERPERRAALDLGSALLQRYDLHLAYGPGAWVIASPDQCRGDD